MQLRTHNITCKYANLSKAGICADSPGFETHYRQPLKINSAAERGFATMNIDPLLSQDDNDLDLTIDTFDTTFCASVTQVEAKKRTPKCKKDDIGRSGISQWGPNWNEDDSILLVKAYKYSDEKKKCTATPSELCQLIQSVRNKRHYPK